MIPDRRVVGLEASAVVYGWLVRSWPNDLQAQYGLEAVQVFRQIYRNAFQRDGLLGVFAVWRRALTQTAAVGLAERFRRHKRRRLPRRPRGGFMERLWQDLRYAMRSFMRMPGFSLTAIAIIAVGIGATTTIFSVVDGVLLRSLPYPNQSRLVYFDDGSHTGPDYRDWLERLDAFETLTAARAGQRDLTNEGEPAQVHVETVTPSYFDVFGATAEVGRLILPSDIGTNNQLAVLSHDFWTSRWSGDTTVIGRTLIMEGEPFQVVGILRDGFEQSRAMARGQTDVFVPLDIQSDDYDRRDWYFLQVVGRLEGGATLATATAQMDAWEAWAATEFPEQYTSPSGWRRDVPLVTLEEATVGEIRPTLLLLLGAVGMMLLIACANVANLFLARATDRQREMALRAALGAGRRRIASQLLTESALLAGIGGIAGIAIAVLGVRAFRTLNPGNVPRIDQVGVDVRILAFAVGAAIVTGLLFGTAPALYAARTDAAEAIKDQGRRASAGGGGLRVKSALVVFETALALMLLTGAALLFHSFVKLTAVEPGFEPDNVMAMGLTPGAAYDAEGARLRFTRDLVERVERIPGVESAAAGLIAPFTMSGRCCYMSRIRTYMAPQPDSIRTVLQPVSPSYFATLGIPLLRGRDLEWDDPTSGEGVIVITPALAEQFFGDEDPIGKVIAWGNANPLPMRVVGVVRDPMFWSLATDDDVNVFIPYAMGAETPLVQIIVRTNADLAALAPAMRQAVWDLDPRLPVPEIRMLRENVAESVAEERFLMTLLATFAAVAILLAAGGVYGTMLYAVSQRHHEFGIRMALGARSGQMVRRVLVQGMVLAATGLALGVGGALALARVLENLVFGITTTDPLTFISVVLLLGTVALLASAIPAVRAARTDPAVTLRS